MSTVSLAFILNRFPNLQKFIPSFPPSPTSHHLPPRPPASAHSSNRPHDVRVHQSLPLSAIYTTSLVFMSKACIHHAVDLDWQRTLPENGNFMTVRYFRGRYWGTVMKILIFVKVRQNPPWKYIFVKVFHTPSRKCTNFVKVCHIPSRECTIFVMLSSRLSRK